MREITMVLMVLLCISVIFTAGCVDDSDVSTDSDVSDAVSSTAGDTGSDKIMVAVTILPQVEFVEKIAGDNVDVVVMVPPGADPHSYEPTTSQLVNFSKAEMYAEVGSGLTIENVMMDKIEDLNSDMLVVDCSEGVTLIEMTIADEDEEAGSLDPHIWTSPANVEIMVENIYEGLVEIDPDNQATYLENKNAYLEELNELDESIQTTLSGNGGSSFMVYHPAWGYFADHYGLTQVAVEIEGKEPSAQDLQGVIDEANEKGIKVIFVQTGFSTVSAEAIASEIGGEVVEVDPLAKDYIDNLAKVAEAFEKGMA